MSTWIVAQNGQGQFATIQPALDAARPGDTVLVHAGTYVADVSLRQGVTLCGVGAAHTRLVAASEMALVARDITDAVVRELTLDGAGKDNHCAVWLVSATVTFEACVITGAKLSGIEAKERSVLIMRGNTIRDNAQNGVFIYEDGEGVLEANTLLANGLHGIEVRERGRLTAQRNTIRDNAQDGVFIYEDGEGVLEANTLLANGLHGIEVRERGRLTAQRNTIRDNAQDGVFIYEDGEGVLEANTLLANGLHGIGVRERGRLSAQRNTIRDNAQAGVFISQDSEGVLEANTLLANGISGIQVRERGRLSAQRNTIRDNAQGGVLISQDGEGVLEANTLLANGLHGIEVRERGRLTAYHNTIVRSTHCGVWVYTEGRVHLHHNIIAYNTTWGVSPKGNSGDTDAAELTLSHNCLWSNSPNYEGNLDSSTDLIADPCFVDVDPDSGDYHLQPSSPCIGAGLDGTDLGAYPYQSAAPRQSQPRQDMRILPHLRTLPLSHTTPPTPTRPALWLRNASASGATLPLCLAHDLGTLLAQPEALALLSRPAHLPADVDTSAYLSFLQRLAAQPLVRAVSTWHLSDAVIGAVLARLVDGVTFAPAYTVPGGADAVAFARHLSTCLVSTAPARLWQDTPPAQRPTLDSLLPPPVLTQIATNLQQLDRTTLRFLHQYGPRLNGTPDPQELWDLRTLLDLPRPAQLAIAQSMHLLPHVSQATPGNGMQTYAMGGYAGLIQRGNLDSLLPTELAYPAALFYHRLLNHEALYYGRDSDREPQRALAYIVTQLGLELRGDGEVLARALTLALSQTLQQCGYDVQHSFVGSQWTPPEALQRPDAVQRVLYYRDHNMLQPRAMLSAASDQLRAWRAQYRQRQVLWVVSEHWDADTWPAHTALYQTLHQLAEQQAWFIRVGQESRRWNGDQPASARQFPRYRIIDNARMLTPGA